MTRRQRVALLLACMMTCAVAVVLAVTLALRGHQPLAYSWSQPAGQLVTSPSIPAHLQYTWHAVEATP